MVIFTFPLGFRRVSAASSARVSATMTTGKNDDAADHDCHGGSSLFECLRTFRYSVMPAKLMNAIDISPVNSMVMPSPRRAAGTLE